MPDEVKPVIEKTVETKEVVKTSGTLPSLSPLLVTDDWIRKAIAVGILIQFTIYVGFVTWLLVYLGKDLTQTANNILIIILTAEITYMGQTFGYYMGSSSAAQSAIANGKK